MLNFSDKHDKHMSLDVLIFRYIQYIVQGIIIYWDKMVKYFLVTVNPLDTDTRHNDKIGFNDTLTGMKPSLERDS